MNGPDPSRQSWWDWIGVLSNAGLVVTVFLPWRFTTIDAPAPTAPRPGGPLTVAATHEALDAVHRVLAAESVARAALEVVVLAGALVGGTLGLWPWISGKAVRRRHLCVAAWSTLAAATAACWVVPAFEPATALSVHVGAITAPAAYAAFGLASTAVAAMLLASTPRSIALDPPTIPLR